MDSYIRGSWINAEETHVLGEYLLWVHVRVNVVSYIEKENKESTVNIFK
jgi:hypothetical protein